MGSPILRAGRGCFVHRASSSGPLSPDAVSISVRDVTHATVAGMALITATLLLGGLAAGAFAPAPGGPGGQWPLVPATVVRGFAPPSVEWGAGHRGLDLAAHTGQDVHSMRAGVVSFVGSVAGVPVVAVTYGGDGRLRSTYEPVAATVTAGDEVPVGGLLGTVAAAGGHCGGSLGCLHVGLRTDTRYLDPTMLVARSPAVLKPQR